MSPSASGDDVDAGEGETLEETGRVLLVAAEAIQRFGEHDVEASVQVRGCLNATIVMPVGAEPGDYEVQLLDSTLQSRATSKRTAAIVDYVTTLET